VQATPIVLKPLNLPTHAQGCISHHSIGGEMQGIQRS
jgi:hypothetical protein